MSNYSLSARQRMSLSFLLSQSRLSLPIHHMTWGAWTASHADGLAWLFSAWLAQILPLTKVQNSNTYKSHRYTSQLKQHKTQHSNFINAHSCSLNISHRWVEEACWARILLSGTVVKIPTSRSTIGLNYCIQMVTSMKKLHNTYTYSYNTDRMLTLSSDSWDVIEAIYVVRADGVITGQPTTGYLGALTIAPPPSWTLWHSDPHHPAL